MKRLIWTFLLICFAVAGISALDEGDKAAPFANMDLNGNFVFSSNFIGSEWVLIDFFATWCKPCKEELPVLESIFSEYKDKGLSGFIFGTDEEGASKLSPFFSDNPTSMTVLLDPYMVAAERYGVEGLPAVFLVNPEGNIVLRGDGFSEETIERIKTILSENLNE